MKISVAMCTYNGADFLPEQLQSFVAQTRLPDELIVCDDCSKDSTVNIIHQFSKTAPFIVRLFVNETNLGLVKNFEKAISLCEGDIIFLSDQDDVWLPEKLQLFEAEFLKDDNIGLVFCNAEIVDEKLNSYNFSSWKILGFGNKRVNLLIAGQAFNELRKGNFISGCMMAFRSRFKSLICPIPDKFPNMIHDYWIALLLSTFSKVIPLQSQLVKYRQHSKQQLGLEINLNLKSKITLKIKSLVLENPFFNEELPQMLAVRERLIENIDLFPEATLGSLNQYVMHLNIRNSLSCNRFARIPVIWKELISLRYHRFSNGVMSAARDLIG